MSEERSSQRWLFSAREDALAFGGSAALSLALLVVGERAGLLDRPFSRWGWVVAVLLCDVAHVWTTLFRVYLDEREFRSRTALYLLVPVVVYALGVALHALSSGVFWTALSYTATYHFVRQQYGWVALYKRRNEKPSRWDDALDELAIYTATLFPLVYWHAHLPRDFAWLMPGDYVTGLPTWIATVLHPVHFVVLGGWALRQAWRWKNREAVSLGKVVVIASTWACWYAGIVAFDSDYAFTVTNVFVHAAPYFVLLWRYTRGRVSEQVIPGEAPPSPSLARWVVEHGVWAFLLVVWSCAFVEELLWDQLVWHDRSYFFSDAGLRPGALARTFLVPLLALPQATHYVLDGFLWRAGNPGVAEALGWRSNAPAQAPSANA